VVGDVDVFFLRHTFLVFFGGVGGVGIGSSDEGLMISKSSHMVSVIKAGIFLSFPVGSVGGSWISQSSQAGLDGGS
jgi:hypothetical protein